MLGFVVLTIRSSSPSCTVDGPEEAHLFAFHLDFDRRHALRRGSPRSFPRWRGSGRPAPPAGRAPRGASLPRAPGTSSGSFLPSGRTTRGLRIRRASHARPQMSSAKLGFEILIRTGMFLPLDGGRGLGRVRRPLAIAAAVILPSPPAASPLHGEAAAAPARHDHPRQRHRPDDLARGLAGLDLGAERLDAEAGRRSLLPGPARLERAALGPHRLPLRRRRGQLPDRRLRRPLPVPRLGDDPGDPGRVQLRRLQGPRLLRHLDGRRLEPADVRDAERRRSGPQGRRSTAASRRRRCTTEVHCPAALRVPRRGGPEVGCISPCARFGTDRYCCRGPFAGALLAGEDLAGRLRQGLQAGRALRLLVVRRRRDQRLHLQGQLRLPDHLRGDAAGPRRRRRLDAEAGGRRAPRRNRPRASVHSSRPGLHRNDVQSCRRATAMS